MTEKDLRHLSRADLVDIIYELGKQNQQKAAACQKLQDALNKREIILSNAGSIAEAAMQINGVMEAAQAAAVQYVLSLQAANDQIEQMLAEARAERERILQDANEQAAQILEKAQAGADWLWNDFQAKASEMVQASPELMALHEEDR